MKTFNLYDVLKGFVRAETEEDAINKIKMVTGMMSLTKMTEILMNQ